MDVKLMEFGTYVRKGAIFTMRGCYRSVWNHPFLVFLVCAFLYNARSYPYLFSLLISASPVLLCTAALLGTLLFYGQQNIPETETGMKTRCDVVTLKKGLPSNACVERYSESKRGEVEEESSLLVNKLAEIRVGGKERSSVGSESDNSEISEAKGELDDIIEEKISKFHEEILVNEEAMDDHYAIISKVIGDLLESESEKESKSEGADSSDSERDDDGSDSGSDSDKAESSSPDASMDEMMPILDELHPLLDEGAAKPELTEQSPRSSMSSSVDSGEETEVQESEGDHTKPVITWTEEDEKNLMDVGSSEVERNQRLERILRRRRNMSMVPEINLMEFENRDFQFYLPPISTARRNPFDLPHDSSAPGSAPSIMSQRRNPFDLPYDEAADLDESQARQPFLRRRDNFLARLSIFAPKRQERHLSRFRPFFVPEETPTQEPGFSPLKVQSSETDSSHETESVSSVEYVEDQNQSGSEDGENSTNSRRESLKLLDDEAEIK